MSILSKLGITPGKTIKSAHVLQIIDAFTATKSYDILISGSLSYVDGTEGAGKVLISDASGNLTYIPTGSLSGVGGSGTLNYVPKFTPDGSTLGDSIIYDDGTNVGINTTTPSESLHVNGNIRLQGNNDKLILGTYGEIYSTLDTGTRTINYLVPGGGGTDKGSHRFRVGYAGANLRDALWIGANADTSTSNIGINTTTPTSQFEVNPDSNLSSRTIASIGTLKINGAGDVYNNGAGGITSDLFLGLNVARNRGAIGSNNVGIGEDALENAVDIGNTTAIGNSSLNSIVSPSGANTALGSASLRFLTTGSSNLALGDRAGQNISSGAGLTEANKSIFIGDYSVANANGETNQIVIGVGELSNLNSGLGSNTTRIGNDNTTLTKLEGVVETGIQFKTPVNLTGSITANAFTFDCNVGTTQKLDLQAATTGSTLSFSNQIEGNTYSLIVVQGSGTHDLTFPSGWWLNDTSPFDFATLADNDRAMVTATYLDSEWYFAVKQLTQVI